MAIRWFMLLPAVFACRCAALTPEGARVSVYRAALDGLPPQRSMPAECRLLGRKPPVLMTELDMEGQKDPFRMERNAAGAIGANALLVLSQMTVSRHDSECPGSSPITDCPPSFGAWFRVVIERYVCAPDALRTLSTPASEKPHTAYQQTSHQPRPEALTNSNSRSPGVATRAGADLALDQ
jgi:hypothetical protein